VSDYRVGYRKPPKHSRFKKGLSGNPKGRPKRKAPEAGEIVMDVLNATAEYSERGRIKKAPRWMLVLKTLVKFALKGDVRSAETLLTIHAYAIRFGNAKLHEFQVHDWSPDYQGQTGEQKTREFAEATEADTPAWWKPADPINEDS
jgi:hypothetical protein